MNIRLNSKELGSFKKNLIAIWRFIVAIMNANHKQSPRETGAPATWVIPHLKMFYIHNVTVLE